MRFTRLLLGLVLSCAGLAACGDADGDASGGGGASNNRTMALSYARDDLACTSDSDCCIVIDGCLADAYLIRSGDKDAVRGLLDSADKSACLGCIPPAVEGRCGANGVCTMADITCTSGASPSNMFTDHCGRVELPAGCSTQPQAAPGSPTPGIQPQVVKGCGAGH